MIALAAPWILVAVFASVQDPKAAGAVLVAFETEAACRVALDNAIQESTHQPVVGTIACVPGKDLRVLEAE